MNCTSLWPGDSPPSGLTVVVGSLTESPNSAKGADQSIKPDAVHVEPAHVPGNSKYSGPLHTLTGVAWTDSHQVLEMIS
jgi:hypothetical protein